MTTWANDRIVLRTWITAREHPSGRLARKITSHRPVLELHPTLMENHQETHDSDPLTSKTELKPLKQKLEVQAQIRGRSYSSSSNGNSSRSSGNSG